MLEVYISKHSPFSSQDHGRLSAVLWCVWCVLCVVLVLVLVFGRGAGCVLCGWCVVFISFFSLFLLSSFPLLSYLFCLLFLFLFLFSLLSSLLATKHCGKNRSTNTAANFEAFECDLAHGRCTAVGSLPPSLLPPPFSPSPPQKK